MKISKEDRKIIKQLKEEKKFDEIYEKYGRKIYLKNTPYKYKKDDRNQLAKKGRIEDIYLKYGERKYRMYLSDAKYKEIKEIKGKKAAFFYRFRRFILSILIAYSTPLIGVGAETDIATYKNSIVHSDEINEYEKKITEYAKVVNKYGFTDIQVFMKVYQDIWINARSF